MLSAKVSGEAIFFVENPEIEAMVVKITKCESESLPDRWGDCDRTGIKNERHCHAFGVAQFWKSTFYRHAKLANLEHPEWKSTKDQLTLLRWALRPENKIYAREWSCYHKIYK